MSVGRALLAHRAVMATPAHQWTEHESASAGADHGRQYATMPAGAQAVMARTLRALATTQAHRAYALAALAEMGMGEVES